jgi:predicted dithiol-disulfide oxidoreductase (DUF899 family)
MTKSTSERPRVVSREEWLAARKQLLSKEKELTKLRDKLSAQRRALPWIKVDKEYVFEGPNGKATLRDLFEGRRQLIVYHFMFDPSWDEGCGGCSFLVDNIGHLAHLHAADTSLVIVSRAPLTKIEPFKDRMGWSIPWYSSYNSDFNYDFHVTLDEAKAPVEYNFVDRAALEQKDEPWFLTGEQPGLSVFLRDGHSIFHTYSTYARGGELLLGTFNYLDLTPLGRHEDEGIMSWVRLHDRYDEPTSGSEA